MEDKLNGFLHAVTSRANPDQLSGLNPAGITGRRGAVSGFLMFRAVGAD